MPWFRAQFDLEGLGFGGLALALAILLGGISWILALFFLILMGIILLASRDCERTSPSGETLVLSPCDGVIESVCTITPPRELRWDAPEVLRVRIASSPFSVNGMRSVITGNIESYLEEPGAPTALAYDPDNADLKEAFILTSGDAGTVGLRLATGGLGPRLDIDLEAGDSVRSGSKIGVRRLGGWSDIYLPANAVITLTIGMTVIGGETILYDLSADGVHKTDFTAEENTTLPTPEVSPVEVKVEDTADTAHTAELSESVTPKAPATSENVPAKLRKKATPSRSVKSASKPSPKTTTRKSAVKKDASEN